MSSIRVSSILITAVPWFHVAQEGALGNLHLGLLALRSQSLAVPPATEALRLPATCRDTSCWLGIPQLKIILCLFFFF